MENQDSICFTTRINKIVPIEGADKIELATVNGWTSIVQKGIHQVGDLVLGVVTDAVIPDHYADQWGVKQYLRKGNRVRTVKLKGVYSECILIPISDIAALCNRCDESCEGCINEGKDMMSNLGIFKYEEPENNHVGLGKGQPRTSKNRINENFNKYYKFPNIKNVPNMFTEQDTVVITRKIHGSNARYGILKKNKMSLWDKVRRFFGNRSLKLTHEYVYGSHNVQKINDTPGYYKTDVWSEVAKRNDIENKLWALAENLTWDEKLYSCKKFIDRPMGSGIVVYGEIYGPGIQGKEYHYDLDEVGFAAFDIEVNGVYLSRDKFEIIVPTDRVEVLYKGKWSQEIQDSFVLNQYINGSKIPHEGVVITCITGDRKKMAKVINPEYHTYAEKHHVPDGH